MARYNALFYAEQREGSYASARVVIGLLIQHLAVVSACDVGCGAGTWVKALREAGVEDVMGFDGAYAEAALEVPRQFFTAADLRQTLAPGRRFDLALSLEVAEHLPAERSSGLVADLTRMAPAVLFSAAIPNQGGTDHINERWQDDWANEFSRHGYVLCGFLPPQIWNNRTVEVWYRQNAMLFIARDHPQAQTLMQVAGQFTMPPSVVHPDMAPLTGHTIAR